MSTQANANIDYSVQINIGGIGMALFSIFNGNRSIHDAIVGRPDIIEWGPHAQLEPWLEMEFSPPGGLLGGVRAWGEEIDNIHWE